MAFSRAGSSVAQDQPCTARTVMATVVDHDGNPVEGLQAADFRGEFRGKGVQVLSATLDTSPRRIVLLLDASGSIAASSVTWRAVKRIAEGMVRSVPPSNPVALMVFTDEIRSRVPFGQPRDYLTSRVAALGKPDEWLGKRPGRTALFDAIMEALAELRPTQPGDIIYLITDGGENASRHRPPEVKNALLTRGVRLFTLIVSGWLHPGSWTAPPRERQLYGERLREIAEVTGGCFFSLAPVDYSATEIMHDQPTSEERDSILRRAEHIYQQMGHYYRIEVKLPSAVDQPRGWKLEVVDERGKKRKGVELAYPRKLLPCDSGHRED